MSADPEMKPITFTGTYAVDQPNDGLHWEPGQTQQVPADVADAWDADPDAPFSGPNKKAAREAKVAAAQAAQEQQAAQTPAEQPATSAVQEGTS